jgi:hypothetical protein
MKKAIVTSFFIAAFCTAVNAQNTGSDYTTALGFKFYPTGVSLKSFIKPGRALEGIGYFYSDGFRITGLYELHYDIEGVDGLKWYIGPGAHIAFWNNTWENKYPGNSSTGIGIDGVLGLDYKINGLPINISADWQPSFNFVGYNYFEGGWGGLGIRYTF